VQVHLHDQVARLVRPYKELKGFAKVELQPGETKTVSIPLDFRAFAYYDPAHNQWVTEDGQFDVLFGASAADIRSCVTVTLQSTLQLPSVLHRESTIRDWLEDPCGRLAFEPMYQQLIAQTNRVFSGGDDSGSESIGMDPTGFMLDILLLSILQFQEDALTQPADHIVALMLEQVHRTNTS
jgi:beta-glucosidase